LGTKSDDPDPSMVCGYRWSFTPIAGGKIDW